jgi:hypothetical protein
MHFSFQEGTSEESQELATLVLRRSTYELRRNGSRQVISEKYAIDVFVCCCTTSPSPKPIDFPSFNFSSSFLRAIFKDIKCPPNALRNFSMCFKMSVFFVSTKICHFFDKKNLGFYLFIFKILKFCFGYFLLIFWKNSPNFQYQNIEKEKPCS